MKQCMNIGFFPQLNVEIWLAGLTYSGDPTTNAAHWMANLIEMCKLAKNCRQRNSLTSLSPLAEPSFYCKRGLPKFSKIAFLLCIFFAQLTQVNLSL